MQYAALSCPAIVMCVHFVSFLAHPQPNQQSQFHSQIAIGTKNGEILIYDLASSSLIDTIEAHTASIWSIHVRPDERALVSGSADKDVKFWEFESKDGGSYNVRVQLTL